MSYNYDDIVFRTEARGSPGSALSSTFMGELSGDFKETCRHDPTLLLRTMEICLTNVVRKFLREDSSPSCFPFDVQVEYRRGSVIVSLLLPLLWAISLDDVWKILRYRCVPNSHVYKLPPNSKATKQVLSQVSGSFAQQLGQSTVTFNIAGDLPLHDAKTSD